MATKLSDADFVGLVEREGATAAAKSLGLALTNVYARRRRLEDKIGRQITGPAHHNSTRSGVQHSARAQLSVLNGVVLVGSDCHYWPDLITPAHRAFVHFCKELQPKAVVMNGDVLDGASISRHAPIGWESRPSLIGEIETCKLRLDEIKAALPEKCKRVWTLGNHDARFETRLATVAPEYAKLHGVHLHDHFPHWSPAWAAWVNDDVVIKHRFKSGMHAPHNNTMWAGKTMVTGHLHSAKVMPITDYNGTRWGVDTGTMAQPGGPQFLDYTEDNPTSWRQAFGVFTFWKGRLLWPELVVVISPCEVEFRGKVILV